MKSIFRNVKQVELSSSGSIVKLTVLCDLEEGDEVICTKTIMRGMPKYEYESFIAGRKYKVLIGTNNINLAEDSKGINRYLPADSFDLLTVK